VVIAFWAVPSKGFANENLDKRDQPDSPSFERKTKEKHKIEISDRNLKSGTTKADNLEYPEKKEKVKTEVKKKTMFF